jgi:hypothetical protein
VCSNQVEDQAEHGQHCRKGYCDNITKDVVASLLQTLLLLYAEQVKDVDDDDGDFQYGRCAVQAERHSAHVSSSVMTDAAIVEHPVMCRRAGGS